MKKLLFISIFTICAMGIQAQTQTGKFFFSGGTQLNASFVDTKDTYGSQSQTSHYSSITLQSSVGYFVAENMGIGLNAIFFNYKNDTYTSSSSSFGPMARFYLSSTSIKPYLNGNIGLAFSRSKESSSMYNSDSKANGFVYGGGLGLAFFLNEKVSLDVFAGYSGSSLKDSNDSSIKSSQGSVVINLGFTVCL